MATPVFKFQHPDLPEEDLYFIHNTFFELPATVPMDLASLVWYHKETNRVLEGFIYGWKNLCEHQTTLEEFTFESHFNEIEKHQLYQDALFANALEVAIHHRNYSNILKTMLNENRSEQELFEVINTFGELKVEDPWFYLSRHQLMSYLWENHQEKFDDMKSYQKNKEVISELVKFSGLGLVFADEVLKRDIDLLCTAVKADDRSWIFVPNDLEEKVQNQIKNLESMEDDADLPF